MLCHQRGYRRRFLGGLCQVSWRPSPQEEPRWIRKPCRRPYWYILQIWCGTWMGQHSWLHDFRVLRGAWRSHRGGWIGRQGCMRRYLLRSLHVVLRYFSWSFWQHVCPLHRRSRLERLWLCQPRLSQASVTMCIIKLYHQRWNRS